VRFLIKDYLRLSPLTGNSKNQCLWLPSFTGLLSFKNIPIVLKRASENIGVNILILSGII
jgi:hypothetical protein